MSENCLLQVSCAAVMQEENSLANSPQRSCAELRRSGRALTDAVGKSGAHIVNE